MSQIGHKRGENMVLKSCEWYYIDSIFKYYQLTLFLVLIRKFDQPDWPELGLIRVEYGLNREKT